MVKGWDTYRLLLVAFSICSSRAVLAPDDHQLIMVDMGGPVSGKGCEVRDAGDVAMRQTDEDVGVELWELRRGRRRLTDRSRERRQRHQPGPAISLGKGEAALLVVSDGAVVGGVTMDGDES